MSLGSACVSRKDSNAIIQALEFCLKGMKDSGVLGCCGHKGGTATVSNRTTQQARWRAASDQHWAFLQNRSPQRFGEESRSFS